MATFFQEMFSGFYPGAWHTLACCRVSSTMRFRLMLNEKGFKTPRLKEMNNDFRARLIGDRIWFAGQKRELEWQANYFAEIFGIP